MPKKKSDVRSKGSRPQAKRSATRRVKQPTYKSFRLAKRIRQPKPPLKGAFRLFLASCKLLFKHWRLFGSIVLVYLVLTIILVKGFGTSSGISQLKDTAHSLFHGSTAELSTGLTLFSVLLSNTNSPASSAGGTYQSILLISVSLALIWALRQTLATNKIRITMRDTFYKGLYPLVPFVLVLLVITLQLIPLIVANFLYSLVFPGGLAVTVLEKGLWAILLGLLALLSLYMITSSIFALYIVTLPDVRPLQALRSARDLVRHRRFMIMRKLLFLPLTLLIGAAVLVVPVIIVAPALAEWLFFGLSMLALAVVHSYLYNLYRELL